MPVLGANCRHNSGEMEKVVRFVPLSEGTKGTKGTIANCNYHLVPLSRDSLRIVRNM